MKLSEKNEELEILLEQFIIGKLPEDKLQKFVWEIIDFFSNTEEKKLPQEREFEKVFWYVIWQVQHLATEDHIKDGSARKVLVEALAFLKGERRLPEEYVGRRP